MALHCIDMNRFCFKKTGRIWYALALISPLWTTSSPSTHRLKGTVIPSAGWWWHHDYGCNLEVTWLYFTDRFRFQHASLVLYFSPSCVPTVDLATCYWWCSPIYNWSILCVWSAKIHHCLLDDGCFSPDGASTLTSIIIRLKARIHLQYAR
jgi:hypothetical protein